MPLVSLDQVTVAFGLKPLLDHVDFTIDRGEKICLLGKNGEGKSTFLKVLNGDIEADSGFVRRENDIRIAMLQQDVPDADKRTVFEVVASGLSEIGALLSEYHALLHQMESAQAVERLARVQEEIERVDGWQLDQQVEQTLARFSLDGEQCFGALSGGRRRRVLLARALVGNPDLLLLDEPTNHLDIPAIEWLEQIVASFQGSVLFISHDRSFIRKIATTIIELDRGNLTRWEGGYDRYLGGKAKQLEDEARQNAEFDKKLSQEEAWIRQGIKARRTRNMGRVRALEQLRRERKERRERSGAVNLNIGEGEGSGKIVAEVKGVSFAYGPGEPPVIKNLNALVMRGDRIGVMGPNGAGKTTLVKLLLGALKPTQGNVKLGTRLEVAFFDQLKDTLDESKSVIDNLCDGREFVEINGKDKHAISYLNDFLFTAERARTPVAALSGGEKSRLLLAKIFSRPANLLVLDEPTNDLDVETLELLEEVVAGYSGTVIVISHDRQFLDNTVSSTLVVNTDGSVDEYVGGFTDWLRQGGNLDDWQPAGQEGRQNKRVQKQAADSGEEQACTGAPIAQSKPKKLSYKLKRELELLPEEIADLEEQLASLQEKIDSPEFYKQEPESVSSELENYTRVQETLEVKMARWVELEEMAGE